MPNLLNRQAGKMFRLASFLNTLGHFMSGDPKRIIKHLIRKRAHKGLGSLTKWDGRGK